MSKFTGPLTITEISADDELWRFDEPLVYYKVYDDDGASVFKTGEIITPAGFISDGASVPSVFERVWPRWGKWRRPAGMHDYLCGRILAGMPHPEAKTRDIADGIFLEAMAAVGVKEFDRFCLYFGARLATWFPSLSKGVVKNRDQVDWIAAKEGQPNKQPSIITNKTEIIEGIITSAPAVTVVETNQGDVPVPVDNVAKVGTAIRDAGPKE